ncbi:mannose-6-phosphate isomerase-like [Mya arenaria]|uniref:mannose-6-phosphate isomerase-like n=1 Tax=Mya arenaria TaxID=6604 RepID=UPI0022E29FA4|nr:mannose-6-phosphate isomerase-like [Mya arenaria]
MAATNGVFELNCAYQNYAWGKVGSSSEVAKLLKSGNASVSIEEQTPYAELWMGTHPSAPSTIPMADGQSLADWVQGNPDGLGKPVRERFGGALPFLFKVLSVQKSLSIQAHPSKAHAEELHKRDPTNYRDPNHKPEMAIALTNFTGLCGFRPIQEIVAFVDNISQLQTVIGADKTAGLMSAGSSDNPDVVREAIAEAFGALMRQNKDIVKTQLSALVAWVKELEAVGKDTSHYVGDILLKLDREFPGDVGGFSVFFLNVIHLKKGEAIFLEANLPHAYLSGDCMECMACSDNVVRAGLTPKFIDTETLLQMLNYTGKPAEDNKYQPSVFKENGVTIRRFTPPIADFSVTEILVDAAQTSFNLQTMDSASIIICIAGSGTLNGGIKVHRGSVLFIAANESVTCTTEGANEMLLYRAHAGV